MAKQPSTTLLPTQGESTTAPILRSIGDLTVADFISRMPVVLEKPYRECRVPGTKKDFDKLKAEVRSSSSPTAGNERSVSGLMDAGTDPAGNDLENFNDAPEAHEAPSEDGIPLMSARAASMPESLAPTSVTNFNGINATAATPPDCTMAVGPSHVLVAVNVSMTCYTKTGSLVFNIPNLATFLASAVPSGATLFDPRLIYDHYAGRYVLVVGAVRTSPQGSWMIVAASNTSNPSGTWTMYSLNAAATLGGVSSWADYPCVGFDSQAIYVTTNQFSFSGSGDFQQSRLRVLKKSQIYAGAALTWVDFNDLTNNDGSKAFSIQPCSHFHGGGNSKAYLTNAYWPNASGASKLTLWKLENPITTPTLTKVAITVNNFKSPPVAVQPGGSLDSGDVRLLNAMYQFAGGVQRLWTAHTVRVQWSGDSVDRTAVRWYEIDVNSNTAIQQQDYGAMGSYYCYPVIQTDAQRNAFMVFTAVNSSTFAQMRQTGRRVAGPLSTMEASALVKAGLSTHTTNRWGDYYGIARDPSNTNEVWGFAEYANVSGQWGTWIVKMRY